MSWLFLHQVQQDIHPHSVVALLALSATKYINPKGVVALLTLSATRYKPLRCRGSSYIKCNKIEIQKVSWHFLHQVQQDRHPKGVVALLALSATRYKP